MIEDLDAIEPAPLESQRTPTKLCSCEEVDVAGTRERGDRLRKIRSTEVRWATSSFLSPDDAIWDLRRRTSEGTEFRWELHTSSTDLDLAKKTRCSCHSLTPEEKKPEGAQRGDLRKHHSAETDKWSDRPGYLLTPMHDLRKHSSDDTRFAREARWLQVPDVMPNPKPRCTCPKVRTPAPESPVPAPTPAPAPAPASAPEQKVLVEEQPAAPAEKLPTAAQKEERRLYYSKSLTPEESAAPWEKPEMKRQASEQPKPIRIEKPRERPRLERSAQVRSESSRKWGLKEKEKIVSPQVESKKPIRARWAMKPHVSLPAEKKAPKWYRSQDETKSKSLRERPKYSIRRSMSPEPDPRQMNKLENRIVRRLISPEITITSTRWAPYEDSSPLPTIGIKKREQKHISEIKWTPYDESPSDIPVEVIDDKKWSPFQNVTPTHCPPPDATPCKSDDEQFRWRMLNQVAPFPLYQGGWRDESPEKTPPKRVTTLEDLSPPVWSPMVPATPTSKRKSVVPQPESPSRYSPSSERRPSKSRLTRKGAFRAKSMAPTTHPLEDRLPQVTTTTALAQQQQQQQQQQQPPPPPPPPPVIVRAASEEPRRQRPQLMRSKALLEVPVPIDSTKRSLSEEGPRMRPRERPRAPGRARSEEVSKYGDPWFEAESAELREYVTTV
ncbi:serine/arginine repetitive matrix protein 1-like [Harpegnathos saltator]|uniref:serine/arginine repetitive matrix protein 1-like n=1 Tax=Harpegnathos saltator TaxID=610380 RepID=UPI000DBEEBE6|nr:serine/arginine repetitive matrix protein 1-like [Harpegnathos saltator]